MQPPPLAGVRVLDLTSVLAGPHATRLLVGLGAEVVKVELPAGDPARRFGPVCIEDYGGFFLQQNVGKRSLCLAWRSEEGSALLRRISASFDVLVDDCPAGLLPSLGLQYDRLSADGRLIQCSITPFGLTGGLSSRPGDGLSAEAMAAVHDVTGYPDSSPLPLGFAFGEYTAGSYAAASIVAALVGRLRGAPGVHIDVSAFDALLAVHDSSIPEFNWTQGQIVRSRPGSDRETLIPYGIFPGRDGFLAVVATSNSAFIQLARAIGVPEWESVEQYMTQAGRSEDRDRIRHTIASWVMSFPSVWDAERLLATSGVIAAVVRDVPDVLAEGLAHARGMIAKVTATEGDDRHFTLNTPFHFRDSSAGLQGARLAGKLGADSRAVLRDCGLEPTEVEGLVARGLVFG